MEDNTRIKDELRAKLTKIQPDSANQAAAAKDSGKDWSFHVISYLSIIENVFIFEL